ncbi:unannotated protein [freshwater metagenome]|uniref:Unannotated protein n=1 Tax=freshwater metagenome TaxID=449393 RepID=A0A6J7IAT3_9ZZZZ
MAKATSTTSKFTDGVPDDNAIKIGVAKRAGRFYAIANDDFGADVFAFDHCRDCNGTVVVDSGAPKFIDRLGHVVYQSNGSMNRWMVPPQVRPTANASSSL